MSVLIECPGCKFAYLVPEREVEATMTCRRCRLTFVPKSVKNPVPAVAPPRPDPFGVIVVGQVAFDLAPPTPEPVPEPVYEVEHIELVEEPVPAENAAPPGGNRPNESSKVPIFESIIESIDPPSPRFDEVELLPAPAAEEVVETVAVMPAPIEPEVVEYVELVEVHAEATPPSPSGVDQVEIVSEAPSLPPPLRGESDVNLVRRIQRQSAAPPWTVSLSILFGLVAVGILVTAIVLLLFMGGGSESGRP